MGGQGWEKAIEDFEYTLPPVEQEVNRRKELQKKKLAAGKAKGEHNDCRAYEAKSAKSERKDILPSCQSVSRLCRCSLFSLYEVLEAGCCRSRGAMIDAAFNEPHSSAVLSA